MTLRLSLSNRLQRLRHGAASLGFFVLMMSLLVGSVSVQTVRELAEESETNEVLSDGEANEAVLTNAQTPRRPLRALVLVYKSEDAPRARPCLREVTRLPAFDGHVLANGLRAPLVS